MKIIWIIISYITFSYIRSYLTSIQSVARRRSEAKSDKVRDGWNRNSDRRWIELYLSRHTTNERERERNKIIISWMLARSLSKISLYLAISFLFFLFLIDPLIQITMYTSGAAKLFLYTGSLFLHVSTHILIFS